MVGLYLGVVLLQRKTPRARCGSENLQYGRFERNFCNRWIRGAYILIMLYS